MACLFPTEHYPGEKMCSTRGKEKRFGLRRIRIHLLGFWSPMHYWLSYEERQEQVVDSYFEYLKLRYRVNSLISRLLVKVK